MKYGYLSVGVVEEGPASLRGRTVFCLYPHQTSYVVPVDALVVVPDGVPPARAVLAGTVETAVNALWDAAPLVGDRVTVVGAGMVGCCVARLLAGIPGVEVTLVDVDPTRVGVASALGVRFVGARRRDRRPRPGRAHHRDVRGAPALARPARAGRDGARAELVRRRARRRCRWAARSTPDGSRSGPARSAPSRRRGAAAGRRRERLALAAGPAARPGVRRPADRRVPVRRAARR